MKETTGICSRNQAIPFKFNSMVLADTVCTEASIQEVVSLIFRDGEFCVVLYAMDGMDARTAGGGAGGNSRDLAKFQIGRVFNIRVE